MESALPPSFVPLPSTAPLPPHYFSSLLSLVERVAGLPRPLALLIVVDVVDWEWADRCDFVRRQCNTTTIFNLSFLEHIVYHLRPLICEARQLRFQDTIYSGVFGLSGFHILSFHHWNDTTYRSEGSLLARLKRMDAGPEYYGRIEHVLSLLDLSWTKDGLERGHRILDTTNCLAGQQELGTLCGIHTHPGFASEEVTVRPHTDGTSFSIQFASRHISNFTFSCKLVLDCDYQTIVAIQECVGQWTQKTDKTPVLVGEGICHTEIYRGQKYAHTGFSVWPANCRAWLRLDFFGIVNYIRRTFAVQPHRKKQKTEHVNRETMCLAGFNDEHLISLDWEDGGDL